MTHTSTVLERFLKYVQIDTQSDEDSENYPSTDGQKVLLELLNSELKELGVETTINKNFYVIATIPSNIDKKVPTIAFLAHVDTTNSVSGKDVKPQVHKNYQLQDIVLPGDQSQIITLKDNPDLQSMKGFDIVTSDGTTLLGADDKAGVAILMDFVNMIVKNQGIKHGEIKIVFNPDEEIGRGVKFLEKNDIGADFAYTLDGGKRGELEYETFSADQMILKFKGKSTHPGAAKDKLINSMKAAGKFLSLLPNEFSPEHTEDRQGFVHPIEIKGQEQETLIKLIVRDFDTPKLKQHEELVQKLVDEATESYPGSTVEIEIKVQYRNMYEVLKNNPEVIDNARQAMKNLGIEPVETPIRGGTDGSLLTFKGVPCPNLFSGQHNLHSKTEWVTVQDMEMATKVLIELAGIWTV